MKYSTRSYYSEAGSAAMFTLMVFVSQATVYCCFGPIHCDRSCCGLTMPASAFRCARLPLLF